MTNAETIAKLNEALEKLIVGYEELQNSYDALQNDNSKLRGEISNLKEKITLLEKDKRSLEDNVNTLQDSTEKDSSNITSMLSKIEGLLSKKNHPAAPNYAKAPNQPQQTTIVEKAPEPKKNARDSFGEIVVDNKEEGGSNSSENKIDLNRMASLLNGFNN
ncbi:hypothetical protein [Halarcobacter ebronensis]|uniref:Uncharacterized protein n=1 Tax=Halarcobacter ebronensis TaxID=1462615 RepID=A0A4Q1AJ80_9BACT|nr:hypothetical protein [Halarcobacter ebronensis]QKF82040.1 hypothetical protein AEBR_1557 [Halarcobacter ebronensis]RXK04126.1 hypothetical protein CRV07_11915 [Halarcobacter ebronensis]